MNPIQKATSNVKTFVQDHKVAIAIVGTAAVTTAVLLRVRAIDNQNLNEFLDENGLLEKFTNTEA